ncbi:MAG: hypothetical protein AB7F89_00830 [Pirellulaceae bacterium]
MTNTQGAHGMVLGTRWRRPAIIRLAVALVAAGALWSVPDGLLGVRGAELFETVVLRGRVEFQSDVFARQLGIREVPEAAQRVLALLTKEGEIVPLVEDTRGRSFRRDERLRGREVEVTVRRHQQTPFVQVVRICEVAEDGLYELDYWCDICSIAMYELKDCDCCQGPIELRRRRVDADRP